LHRLQQHQGALHEFEFHAPCVGGNVDGRHAVRRRWRSRGTVRGRICRSMGMTPARARCRRHVACCPRPLRRSMPAARSGCSIQPASTLRRTSRNRRRFSPQRRYRGSVRAERRFVVRRRANQTIEGCEIYGMSGRGVRAFASAPESPSGFHRPGQCISRRQPFGRDCGDDGRRSRPQQPSWRRRRTAAENDDQQQRHRRQ